MAFTDRHSRPQGRDMAERLRRGVAHAAFCAAVGFTAAVVLGVIH